MKEKLVIIDFLVQDMEVHVYPIDEDTFVDDTFIKKLGFDPNNCEWFFGTSVKIKEHDEDEITQILH